MPSDHAPLAILQLPDVGETPVGHLVIGWVGHGIVAHDDDDVAVLADALDLNFK
jgi:hypothetical protein